MTKTTTTTMMILVAALSLLFSATARAEEANQTNGDRHRTKEPVKLERACGSCHSGASFVVATADYHATHPWSFVQAANVRLAPAQQPAETVKAAFLGIGVEEPSETLRAHLGLPEGVGLVVNFVEEASPASEAGIRQHDVLQKLDEQLLVNEEQLVTLVRLRKSGDSVGLAIIRAGRPENLTVRLGEKRVPAAPVSFASEFVDLEHYVTAATTRPAGEYDYPATYGDALAGYTKVLDRSVSVGPITVDDGTHVIIYTPKEGGVLVAMEKESGTILFNGPVATDEQWQAVPEGVKEKMQELHESFRKGSDAVKKQ